MFKRMDMEMSPRIIKTILFFADGSEGRRNRITFGGRWWIIQSTLQLIERSKMG
jgi:hypothetical protein